jgi:uncharacterized protein (UPF0276 family)
VGFKLAHAADLLAAPERVGFVEIHAENFMGDGGPVLALLDRVAERVPVSVHGVGLSIGGAGPLDRDHLARLAAVARRAGAGLVSEHLAWSTHEGEYHNALLPLPLTEATLARVAEHVDVVQEALGRPMLLENPASVFAFEASTWDEPAFLAEVVRRTGCGLLLDVNNVVVSAVNVGLDPVAFIAALPLDAVGEIHLAGHAEEDDGGLPLLVDTHDRPVPPPVWALYGEAIRRLGRPVPTLVEWDADVPPFAVLAAEAAKAERAMASALAASGPAAGVAA